MTIGLPAFCEIILSCILKLLSDYCHFCVFLGGRVGGGFWSLMTNSGWFTLALNRSKNPLKNMNLVEEEVQPIISPFPFSFTEI